MNIGYYIPFKEACISHSGKNFSIIGISSINILIDRLEAEYKVWIGASTSQVLIDNIGGKPGTITLTEFKCNVPSILMIDNHNIVCTLTNCAYVARQHAYLISLKIGMDRNKVKTYIYDKNNKRKKKVTRFDLMDV